MTDASDKEALEVVIERYIRLKRAAKAVVAASTYPTDPDAEPRVYRSQLKDLERELRNEPQPHSKLSWMSTS